MREAGYAGATIRKALAVLGGVLGHAARRGMIAQNPIRRLERGERPPVERREMRTLDVGEIAALLRAASEPYRTLLATALFTGLRQGELLGLTWGDVDLVGLVVRSRHWTPSQRSPCPGRGRFPDPFQTRPWRQFRRDCENRKGRVPKPSGMGDRGFEPRTSALSERRSNQLS